MIKYTVCMALAMTLAVMAEPPSGYSYSKPGGGGFLGGGGGGYHSGLSGGGGGYTAVSSGYQTSEGQHIDHALLEQVRQILLKEEQSSSSHSVGGFGGHGISSSYGPPSHSYGPPSSAYGVPGYGGGHVIGIDLEGVKQAIQVAQYHQASISHGGGGGGYSYHKPSGSYGAPF
ncbi:hypothetical protein PPYR_05028 [Photinus pyralis]|uniref:DUF4766 domain-containing protein n=2 Tax=Photinus pyralis TaxID=7054 RepID=A0A5N4AZR4_PHOPY|nr:glycine-rich protein 2 [Photinus pyralis]KAB0802842.1 hypothetical protein PPYR_05028 [Photinus pyralis]